MNVWPMIVRFFSGSSTPASASRNELRRVDRDELDAEVRAERALDLLALVQPQQARVDEDAGELVADRAVHERRGDRRVDAARQPADHARRRRRARGSSPPRSRRTRPASSSARAWQTWNRKFAMISAAARRVRDLGMELDAVNRLRRVPHAGDRNAGARRGRRR